ncbi:unnamed protein product, partial [Ectocarpus sp. 8 AP-2014]
LTSASRPVAAHSTPTHTRTHETEKRVALNGLSYLWRCVHADHFRQVALWRAIETCTIEKTPTAPSPKRLPASYRKRPTSKPSEMPAQRPHLLPLRTAWRRFWR